MNVVINLGGERERMPSSDASVSPRQHAKWLRHRRFQWLIPLVVESTHPRDTNNNGLLHFAVSGGVSGHHVAKSYGVCGGSVSRSTLPTSEPGTKSALHARLAANAEAELQRTCAAER